MTSEFVFFSSNPSLNHIKIEKCLLIFATNTNIFTLLFKELKTDGKSFIFAVCGLPYDHVTSNLISLLFPEGPDIKCFVIPPDSKIEKAPKKIICSRPLHTLAALAKLSGCRKKPVLSKNNDNSLFSRS